MARVFIERIQLAAWTLLQLDCYTLLYINYLKQVGLLGQITNIGLFMFYGGKTLMGKQYFKSEKRKLGY